MLFKIITFLISSGELLPLFGKLVDTLSSAKSGADKLDIMQRSTLAAAQRATYLAILPGK